MNIISFMHKLDLIKLVPMEILPGLKYPFNYPRQRNKLKAMKAEKVFEKTKGSFRFPNLEAQTRVMTVVANFVLVEISDIVAPERKWQGA